MKLSYYKEILGWIEVICVPSGFRFHALMLLYRRLSEDIDKLEY